MTDLFTAIIAILAADSATQTALAGGKMWSYWPRTYQTPCLVIEHDAAEEQNQLTGATSGGRVQYATTITCRASDPGGGPKADALRQAVRNLLHGQTINGMDFVLENTADAAVPKAEGSTDHWCDQVMTFAVARQEPIGA